MQVVELNLLQKLPPEFSVGLPTQVFSIGAASVGLAGLATVLALTQQAVLAILDRNVRRGSVVYEKGHIVILSWAVSSRDIEVIWKIASQVVCAFCAHGRSGLCGDACLALNKKMAYSAAGVHGASGGRRPNRGGAERPR